MKRGRDSTDSTDGFLDIPAGSRLGDWRVLRALGQGRFGRVYEAAYEGGPSADMPARAALKVFEGTLLLSPPARAELTKEAAAMRSVPHPNVLRFHGDVILPARSEFAGTRFFVLELGEIDLLEEMNRSPTGLGLAEVTEIAVDLAAGLEAVHRKYVHGDVKPENIIKVERLHKLGDMGVAARLEGTGAYTRPGTVLYRPPEYGRRQGARGRERVGQPYDIWSLGVTLHEILTKHHPYETAGERLDAETILARVQTGPAPAIEVADPVLAGVIGRCLERDPARRATAAELLDILGVAKGFVSRPQSPPPPYPERWNRPGGVDAHRRGRAGLAADLGRSTGRGVVALVGGDGTGRSALAHAHACAHAEDYDVAWWVRARHREVLGADLAALAAPLGLGGHTTAEDARTEAVRDWLAGHDRWLVVFDDVAGEEAWAAVGAVAAIAGSGHVVVTTASAAPPGTAVVEVGGLDRDDAVAFLLARTGDGDGAAAAEVAEALADLPLALGLAGATVAGDGTLAGYLDRLRRRAPELFSAPPTPGRAVAAAVAAAFDHTQRASPAAAELIRLCAFLDGEDIPLDLFARGVGALPKALQRALGRGAPEAAVAVAERAGLLERRGDGLFVHALVADALRQGLGPEGRGQWAAVALSTLHAAGGEGGDDAWARRLLPHVLAALDHPGAADVEADAAAALLEAMAASRRAAGRLGDARGHLEQALVLTEAAHGPRHPAVGSRLFALGSVLVDLGEHDAARRCLARSAAIAEDHDGEADGERLHTLGVLLRDLGDYEEAHQCLEQSLAAAATAHGSDSAEVSVRLNDLGLILRDLGDHSAARDCFGQSLAIAEALYGPEDPELGLRLSNLALVLLDLGQVAAGREAAERSLAIAEAVHGPDHPDVGAGHTVLGKALCELGAYADARRHLELAVSIAETACGRNHPDVGSARASLAMALRGLGDHAGACGHLEAAVAAAEVAHGPNHPEVGIRLNTLGMVLHGHGDDGAARPVLERALAIAISTHGPGHPEVARRHNNVALVLLSLEDNDGARRHLEAANAFPDVAPAEAPVILPLPTGAVAVAPESEPVATVPTRPDDIVDLVAEVDDRPVSRREPKPLPRRRRFGASVAIAVLIGASWATVLGQRTAIAVENGAVVVLAMDVSLSMEAADISPSRIATAKAAAARFVDSIPAGIKVGLVSFAGAAELTVPPTNDRAQVKDGLSKLTLMPRTAVGEALFLSLDTVAPGPGPTPLARIVVLTDGETTVGRPNAAAAEAASQKSVPVATIALGSPEGFVVVEGRNIPVPVNKDAMREMAETTKGRFYEAASAKQLERAYDDLRSFLPYRTVRSGVTAASVVVSLVLGAICGTIAWLVLGLLRGQQAGKPEPEAATEGSPS